MLFKNLKINLQKWAGICGNCSLDNINIGTVRSGREIKGKSEWNVTVINNCDCPQKQIHLGCQGFQTAEPVDPAKLLVQSNGQCLLVNGSTLQGHASVGFSYAWDPPFLLLPHDSVIAPNCWPNPFEKIEVKFSMEIRLVKV